MQYVICHMQYAICNMQTWKSIRSLIPLFDLAFICKMDGNQVYCASTLLHYGCFEGMKTCFWLIAAMEIHMRLDLESSQYIPSFSFRCRYYIFHNLHCRPCLRSHLLITRIISLWSRNSLIVVSQLFVMREWEAKTMPSLPWLETICARSRYQPRWILIAFSNSHTK